MSRLRFAALLAALFAACAVIAVPAPSAYAQSKGIKAKLPEWLGGDKPEFFRLPPFNVPMIRSTGVTGQVTLIITLEARGLDNKDLILQKHTAIQSAFLRDLYGIAAMNNRSGRPVNLNTVKIRLQKVANRVLGAGVVKDVLVAHVYTRRMN